MLLTRINKKSPINTIIYLPQGNMHRTSQAGVHSSVVSRLSKLSDYSSPTLSLCRRGEENLVLKIERKVEELLTS